MTPTESFHSLIREPRRELNSLILKRDTVSLLLKAGAVHGHYCPGLALGVLASVEGLHAFAQLKDIPLSRLLRADGMEDLLVIIETNSCVSDGVQVVTGCTFGNNSMIYHDLGKTAITLGCRSGKGIRVRVAPSYRDIINGLVPEYSSLFERVVKKHDRSPELLIRFKEASADAGFSLLNSSADFLDFRESEIVIPDYASIRETRICARCGEAVIADRTILIDGEDTCFTCARKSFHRLTGEGIAFSNTNYTMEVT